MFNGTLKLLDSSKHSRDMVAFLFTDSLLLTQRSAQTDKKVAKKEVSLIILCIGCVQSCGDSSVRLPCLYRAVRIPSLVAVAVCVGVWG